MSFDAEHDSYMAISTNADGDDERAFFPTFREALAFAVRTDARAILFRDQWCLPIPGQEIFK